MQNISADVSSSNVTSQSDVVRPILLSGPNFSYDLNNTFTLNNQKTAFFILNFWHQLPWKENNIDSKGRSALDAGIKLAFMDKKLQINALVNDIFKQGRSRGQMCTKLTICSLITITAIRHLHYRQPIALVIPR